MYKLISCLLLTVLFVPAYVFAGDNAKGENILPRIDPMKEGKVKSKDTQVAVSITVRNLTKSEISLHWLDEDAGDRVHYKDIEAGGEVLQGTWQGHYWIVLDKNDKPLGIYKAPDKDGVIVVGDSSAATGIVVELEDGVMKDAGADDEHTGFTGTGFANFHGVQGASVESTAMVSTPGTYKMIIRYANGSFENRSLKILVNGKVAVDKLEFKGTGDENWALYRTITVKDVKFKAGKNVIKLITIDEDGPNLDSITIRK
jgi:hypothetical protein